MSSIGAKCGHVKRQLNEGRRLTGEVLEFALSVLPQPEVRRAGKDDFYDLLDGVRQKLRAGQSLSEYEHHIFIDVILLHERLGAATRERLEREQDRR